MGRDIHIHIVDEKGNFIAEEIFDGRNSFWFDRISNEEDEYEHINFNYNWNKEYVPEEIKKIFNDKELGYYGYKDVPAEDLIEWFETYLPNRDAGWVTKYDAWRMNNKGFNPTDVVKRYLDPEDRIEEYEFVEFNTYEDNMISIIPKVNSAIVHNPEHELHVIFYFDW